MIDSLPTAETLTVEFKADRKGPLNDRDLALAALCLANAQGGTLYLGIEDNGTVTGLHPTRDRRKNLAAVIAEGTTPPLAVSVECLELNDLAVLPADRAEAETTAALESAPVIGGIRSQNSVPASISMPRLLPAGRSRSHCPRRSGSA